MSFSKAQRFNPDKVCGPPPTAYDPKHPSASGLISFPKGERFRQDSTPNHQNQEGAMTRAHSASSVGSNDSAATTKSNQGKSKDHSHCNKQIADLEKELRNRTMELNQLLRRRNHPINATHQSENKENTEPHLEVDHMAEITMLNTTIKDLKSKLDGVKHLEEEKNRLENERDSALADLELKEIEVSQVTNKITHLETAFKEEESLRYELDAALKQASDEKREMETQILEYGLKLENLENVRVELVKDIEVMKESQQRELEDKDVQHEAKVQEIRTAHQVQIQELENNLQQLVAEHDAESEQLKFEFGRQIEELNQNHLVGLAKLKSEQEAQINAIQLAHREQLSQLEASRDELEAERLRLRQQCEKIGVTLETKSDEIETLKAQLDVAEEKLETNRAQAEERFSSMKRTLELDIAECRVRSEEQRRNEEEKLRSCYETKLALLEDNHRQLTESLQRRQAEFEQAQESYAVSCNQYEEQLKRLNDNNQTEKEILMWQMSQQRENLELELKTDFDQRLSEKEAEFEKQRNEWETKLNQANEDHNNEVTSLISNHGVQLSNYRELHEAALETLEREKSEILEEKELAEKKLMLKEAEIEKITGEMKFAVFKLQLELDMLRESNNQLVADLLRVEQDRQISEERIETEKVELKAKATEEKETLIKSYEVVIDSIKADSMIKEERITELINKLTLTEETLHQQLTEKEQQLEEAKTAHEELLAEISTAHKEEIKTLHKDYEKVLADKEDKFFAEREQLIVAHQETMERQQQRNQTELQELQDEFRTTFSALEKKLMDEKESLQQAHARQLADVTSSYEEKLSIVNKHHEAVVEELNKNNEEAMDNVQELQQSLDDLRIEFQTALATAEAKEAQHKEEVDNISHTIQLKDKEVADLSETIRRREKETADEWIQRETTIMAQFTEQNQKSVSGFETRLQEIRNQLHQSKEETEQMRAQRDAARDDVAVFQVQTEAQIAALNEQYEQERDMLLEKLSVQTREIEEFNSAKLADLQSQLTTTQRSLEELRWENSRQIEQMEHEREEAILTAVREALEPVDNELDALRKDREAYLLLQKEYQDLLARIEPFREQLDLYEAEKKALLSQALFAENSMASLASKYAQLLGHQNSRQKIHHLEKLKQDIFNLRKELADKNLALEKEKKARQKADARVKELSGQKKYDPSEAFKVPENPPAAPAAVTKVARPSAVKPSVTPASSAVTEPKEAVRQPRKPLRPTVQGSGTGFFLSMDDIEKTSAAIELEKQKKIEARRQNSSNFEAFDVDFSGGSARRETFDVPPKLNVTRNLNNKENVSTGLFPNDISGISISEEAVLKNKLKSRVENLTSTPLQRHT